MDIENVVYPGYIRSQNDGDRHFITGQMLIRLYKLDPRKTLVYNPERMLGRNEENLKHYYPRPDGKYNG